MLSLVYIPIEDNICMRKNNDVESPSTELLLTQHLPKN